MTVYLYRSVDASLAFLGMTPIVKYSRLLDKNIPSGPPAALQAPPPHCKNLYRKIYSAWCRTGKEPTPPGR